MQKNRTIEKSKLNETKLFDNFFEKMSFEISSKDLVVVAVSGGVDSMVLSFFLYHFFIKKGYSIKNLIFVHLNHKVREISFDEAENIKKWFVNCNLEYFVREDISSQKENDLRNRRYGIFNNIMKKHKAKFICLGHHLDDRIETSLLNMERGC